MVGKFCKCPYKNECDLASFECDVDQCNYKEIEDQKKGE